jgi:hypothetical protein
MTPRLQSKRLRHEVRVGIHDGRIITMKQVHGDHLIEVKDGNVKEAGEGDGLTRRALFGILTAIACRSFAAPEEDCGAGSRLARYVGGIACSASRK